MAEARPRPFLGAQGLPSAAQQYLPRRHLPSLVAVQRKEEEASKELLSLP